MATKRQFVSIGPLNQNKERDEEFTNVFLTYMSNLRAAMKIKLDTQDPEVSCIKFVGEGPPFQFEELRKLNTRFPNIAVIPNGNTSKFIIPYASMKKQPVFSVTQPERDFMSFIILVIGVVGLLFYGYRFMNTYDLLRSLKFQ